MVAVDNSEQSRPVTSESSWDNITVGHDACSAGAATPGNCGEITGKNFSPSEIPGSNSFIKAEYCSEEGDSGAGAYRNEKALGIQSGHRDVCNEQGAFSFFGSIEYVQDALDAELVFIP